MFEIGYRMFEKKKLFHLRIKFLVILTFYAYCHGHFLSNLSLGHWTSRKYRIHKNFTQQMIEHTCLLVAIVNDFLQELSRMNEI